MRKKERLKMKWLKVIFSGFFIFTTLFGGLISDFTSVQAVPVDDNGAEIVTDTNNTDAPVDNTETPTSDTETTENTEESEEATDKATSTKKDTCENSLGRIAWMVCSFTETISKAVDALYAVIEDILIINPVSAKDGTPIYEVWKYCRGVTNIVFIIFLLVVIYSQITGIGISNYGIKKILPKLIVTAILVNLSFLICSLAVDVSNIIGASLRGLFDSVAETAIIENSSNTMEVSRISMAEVYGVFAGGGVLTIGVAVIAFNVGLMFMLIPVVLGAAVAVVSGLITIALRQGVVSLLIMVSPLAMVAYMLPNTDDWFKKWKKLFTQMLVFYPMFSLLFGASNLAGFAIITSAKSGFMVLLGMAVQTFPLFFCWNLMKMSNTFLGTINSKMHGLAARPLAANRAWADSHRQLKMQRHLDRNRMPSAKVMTFLASRRDKRESEIDELSKHRQLRYAFSRSLADYNKDGTLNKAGQKRYDRQALSMRYTQGIKMHENNMNEGFSDHDDGFKKTISNMKKDLRYSRGVYASAIKGKSYIDRIESLDEANKNASDDLKFEVSRGAKIDYRNAEGFQKRMVNAVDAHLDQKAIDEGNLKHQLSGALEDPENIARYDRIKAIMGGKEADVHFAAMDAASTFNAQAQIVRNKFQTYTDLTPDTQGVMNRLSELTMRKDSSNYIDPIIAGLRTLNMRGDTDLVRTQIENVLNNEKVKLGTYTSQALANFCMFEVKGGDPFLRRFGKYINLETAAMYNEPDDVKDLAKRRQKDSISMDEYINGEYEYVDHYTDEGIPVIEKRKVKRDAATLLNGTSFKDMERTAIKNMTDAIRNSSVDENGDFDMEKFKKNEERIWNAIMPNIIGDQFSFLSGSEQIMALSKGLTGVDWGKREFDWEGIFGKEIAKNLTSEQKKDYIEFINKRTSTFLGGHVPVQIAKTKTDVLEAVKTQYAIVDAILNGEGSLDDRFKYLKDKDYDTIYGEHKDGVKNMFVKSFKEDALKGFAKMYQKGYQGEAKGGLIELLKDELERQVYKDAKEQREKKRKFDEEEGMRVNVDDDDIISGSGEIYNNARLAIENIYKKYSRENTPNAVEFWKEVSKVIGDVEAMGGTDWTVDIVEVGNGVTKNSNIHDLYNRIMTRFFNVKS